MTEVCEGEIVAAPFDSDNLWYRAEVSGVEDDRVDLYYGDFGDSCWVSKDRIRRLRSESSRAEKTHVFIKPNLVVFELNSGFFSKKQLDRFWGFHEFQFISKNVQVNRFTVLKT